MAQGKQFMPMTFVKAGKKYFTDGRMLILFLLFLGDCLCSGVLISVHSTWYAIPVIGQKWFLGVAMLALQGCFLFVARIFVIQEKQLKASYVKQRNHHITNLEPFWSIFDIDQGRILYIDGRVGRLIALRHGHKYGRPPKHRSMHFTRLTNFIGELAKKGYELKYYNIEVSDPNTRGLNRIQGSLDQFRHSKLYKVESLRLDYIRNVCKKVSDIEYEYYLVIANTMTHVTHMDEDIRIATQQLKGTLYDGIKICDEPDIFQFITLYYGIRFADIATLMSNQVFDTGEPLITVMENFFEEEEEEAPLPPEEEEVDSELEQLLRDASIVDRDLILGNIRKPELEPEKLSLRKADKGENITALAIIDEELPEEAREELAVILSPGVGLSLKAESDFLDDDEELD